MRGKDPNSGDFLGDSRTQQRREALSIKVLGERLVEASAAQLARLPIDEELRDHVEDVRKITSHIARKRQLLFLAKQLRREDDATLAVIRDALDAGGAAARRETATLHRAEQWRLKLIDGGDSALGELLVEYPDADRQRLRTLVRNVADERAKHKPPAAFRELFREIREVMDARDPLGVSDSDADEDEDDAVEFDDARDDGDTDDGWR